MLWLILSAILGIAAIFLGGYGAAKVSGGGGYTPPPVPPVDEAAIQKRAETAPAADLVKDLMEGARDQ